MADYRPMSSAQSSALKQDPFYTVKEKVVACRSSVDRDFSQWKEANATQAENATKLKQQIKINLSQISIDLNDLQQTIDIVTNNRSKFTNIDDQELNSRKKFVQDIKQFINNINSQLQKSKKKNTQNKGAREEVKSSAGGAAASSSSSSDSSFSRAVHADNTDIVSARKQQQKEIEKEQDDVLDDMATALDRLKGTTSEIDSQLVKHKDMLEDLDGSMGNAQSNMEVVTKKLTKLLGTSDRGRLCCIAMLFVTGIALLFAIIYA